MEKSTYYNILEDNTKFNEYYNYHYNNAQFKIFNEKQTRDLINSGLMILEDYILMSPLCFIHPSVHKDLDTHLHKVLELQISHLYVKDPLMTQVKANNNAVNKEIDVDLARVIKLVFSLFYKFIIPKRSYINTFIRRTPNIHLIRSKITYLQNLKHIT